MDVLRDEWGASYVRAKFSRGAHAGLEVEIYQCSQKLSLLQAGFVTLEYDKVGELDPPLPVLMLQRDDARQIGPAMLDHHTDDPAILNAALEMWDALNEPGSSRRDWYTGEAL